MALRKVKGNFERMFDKNLTDLVRGIRNNKNNEVSRVLLKNSFANYRSRLELQNCRDLTETCSRFT